MVAGLDKGDVKEACEKWKSLHYTAKREFRNYKREANKIAGGPQSKPISSATENLIKLLHETPQLRGLDRVETNGELIDPVDLSLPLMAH